jgi:competence protein ComEC
VDLRLVPVAATVWCTCLVSPYLSPLRLEICAAAATVLAVGVIALGKRWPGAAASVLLAVLAALAVTSGMAALRGAVREGSPLRVFASSDRAADVVLHLEAEPHRLAGPGAARFIADARVTRLVEGVRTQRFDAPVLLFATGQEWARLLPGEQVSVRVGVSLPRPGDDVVAVVAARGPPTAVGRASGVQRIAASFRAELAASSARVLAPRPAGLLPGLVVGDTGAMDPVLAGDFKQAGLTHLTAVSGANVAIVVTGVLWPLRRRAVDRRAQALVGGLALAGFVVLAGPSPSVVRAAAMGAVTLVALAAGRSRAAVPALAASACGLLLHDPGLSRDAGFALSVLATGAIVLLAPGWARRLRERSCPAVLADAVAVSAAAGLVTAPLIAGLSGTISLVSLPANLLAAPAVGPATVLGLLATLLGAIAPQAADPCVWLAGWPTRWLVLVAERAAAVPDATGRWPAGTTGALLLALLLLVAGVALWRVPRLRPLALAAVVGIVVLGWPVRQTVQGWPLKGTVVVACDVGQGDALVLPAGPGAGVLVDTGPDVSGVDRCLHRLGVDTVPLVLLSHLDADHAGGLAGALAGRKVGVVATATLSPADHRVAALDRLVRHAGATRAVLVPGDRRTVGGVGVEVLAPDPARATAAAAPNDLSMVARVTVHGVRVLFTGDLGAEAEARLVRDKVDLRADVLKVPHHGSRDADAAFLAASGARVALISVGAHNTYGHPTARTLSWLAHDGMQIHRTDREGDLAVVASARSWGVAVRGRRPGPRGRRPGVSARGRRRPARGRRRPGPPAAAGHARRAGMPRSSRRSTGWRWCADRCPAARRPGPGARRAPARRGRPAARRRAPPRRRAVRGSGWSRP